MTESEGTLTEIAITDSDKVYLGIIIEPVDDTIDALSRVYEWRIGERVKVVGNEPE